MAKNLEIKVQLKSHKDVKEILNKNKIHFKELLNQKDIYYKVNRGILKLRIENDTQTLIFYDRNEKSKKRWSDYYLLDLSSTDANKYLKRFLDVMVIVKKRRELYLYKNTRIHLDYVQGLGYFLELETRVINGLNDAEKRFNYLLDLLELRSKKEIRASYKDLLLAKKK
ncbi:MAG TPA: class IV adenylate cyclase [Ignavibacteriaceae bacterium]|mgnify:FL=1|nr:class IV adenylate cyclase [Ignavibacteriaceae bacterium]